MDINSHYSVGNCQISNLCLQSFPCKHYFRESRHGTWQMLSATSIYKILDKKGLSDPHFEYCKQIIRRLEHPTAEEIEQDELEYAKSQKQMEEREIKEKKEKQELDAIVNQYKASSHIDRLKLKNNIK